MRLRGPSGLRGGGQLNRVIAVFGEAAWRLRAVWLRLLLVAVGDGMNLTGGRAGGSSLGRRSAVFSLCPRLILRLEVDGRRRLGDRLFLTYQAVLTSCGVAEIPLTQRLDRLGKLVATVSFNSRQILMTPQTHARTAF